MRQINTSFFFLLGFLFFNVDFLIHAEDFSPLSNLSLEELMDIPIEIGTKIPTSIKELPGIITFVTQEQIRSSGARDLVDVLLQVPGFSLGTDVQGAVSLGFRGMWAHEGKVLLLWNGHELNEAFFGTLQLGRRYPLDHIKQIEIIRGPGSVIYGGFGELAVINVVTLKGEDLDGVEVTANYGEMGNTLGGRNLSFSYGKKWEDFSVSLQTFLSEGQRSNQNYQDEKGNIYNLNGNSTLNSNLVNFDIFYKELNFRFFTNFYHTMERDAFGTNLSVPVQTDFSQYSYALSYPWHLQTFLTLKPYLNYTVQTPWQATYPSQINEIAGIPYDKTSSKTTAGIEVSWNIMTTLQLLAGVQADQYLAQARNSMFQSGSNNLFYSERVFFSQLLYTHWVANLTLGARYVSNSIYGSNLVPRVGLTKSLESWNFKLLYSNAYRAPVFENYNTNPAIQPEKTKILEFETTKQFNYFSNLSLNFFAIQMTDPIVYGNVKGMDAYANFSQTGSAGLELQFRLQDRGQYLNTSYSFASALNNQVSSYDALDSTQLLGMSKHKVTIQAKKNIFWNEFYFSPSVLWLSSRQGYGWNDTTQNMALKDLGSVFLLNLYFIQNHFLMKNLSFGFGVMNLLDAANSTIQPYGIGHPSLPGPGREFLTRLSLNIPL